MKEINIGMKFHIKKSFSHENVIQFSSLSGDFNKIHIDKDYAMNTRFKDRICHGMLVASLFSNLIGNNLPSSIYLNQTLSFLNPVYIDEEVEAEVEVLSIIKRRIEFSTVVYKKGNVKAIEGKALVMVDVINNLI